MKLNTLATILGTLAITSSGIAQSLTQSAQALNVLSTVRPAAIAKLHSTPKKHYALLGSMAFMVTGQMLDCISSIGKHEANGMIGNGSDGRFNAPKGFAIKGGIVAGIITAEYFVHRRNGHDLDGLMAGLDAAYGGIGTFAAVHNFNTPEFKK